MNPLFAGTLSKEDERRPRMELGLGVWTSAKYYPMERIREHSLGSTGMASVRRVQRPQQVFARWYGFALTFPGCEIFGG